MFFDQHIANYVGLNLNHHNASNSNSSLLWSSPVISSKLILNKTLDTLLQNQNYTNLHSSSGGSFPNIKKSITTSTIKQHYKSHNNKMPPITEKRSPSIIKGNVKENFPTSTVTSLTANKQFPLSDKSENRVPEIIDFRDSWMQEIEKYKDQVKIKQQQHQHQHQHHQQLQQFLVNQQFHSSNHNNNSNSNNFNNSSNTLSPRQGQQKNKLTTLKGFFDDEVAFALGKEKNYKNDTRRRRVRTRSDSGPVSNINDNDEELVLKRAREDKTLSSLTSSPHNSNNKKKNKDKYSRHDNNRNINNNKNRERKSPSPTSTTITTNINNGPLLSPPLLSQLSSLPPESPKKLSEQIHFQQQFKDKDPIIDTTSTPGNTSSISSKVIVNSYHATLLQLELEKNKLTPENNNSSIATLSPNSNSIINETIKTNKLPSQAINGLKSSHVAEFSITNDFSSNSSNDYLKLTKTTNNGSSSTSNESSGVCLSSIHNEKHRNDHNDIDDDDLLGVIDDVDAYESSSDEDDEYKGKPYYLEIHEELDENIYAGSSNVQKQLTIGNYFTPKSPLSPSLFPNVPPYLNFSSHAEKGPPLPPEIQKILKWKATNVMPKVVRKVIANSGFRLQKKVNDWVGIWDKHMKSPLFKTIRSHQKFNHLPGSFKIGRKDSVWRNLSVFISKHGKREFGIMPKTYVLPQDINQLKRVWIRYARKNTKWIIKPPASARGSGIKVVNKWSQIPSQTPLVVQKYLERPLLIQGNKFDLRLYVIITSVNPLRIFLHTDGLARFASVQYSDNLDSLNDRCMHLTNYSVNKLSSNYAKNEDINACQGHKWTLKSLWSYFNKRGIDTKRLWATLRDLVVRTIIPGESWLNKMFRSNVASKYSCYELFGFDVILDENLVPWLLEVNISPSLHSELQLDQHVKGPLIQAVLNTALYQIPPKVSEQAEKQVLREYNLKGPLCFDKRIYTSCLSPDEIKKHHHFTSRQIEDREDYVTTILEELTPDDVRCLIVAEDELARSSPLERIFPGPESHKYLQFIEGPRYYNRLLDAWESKYSRKRYDGVRLLHKLCAKEFHLQVPNLVTARDSEERIMKAEAAISAANEKHLKATQDTTIKNNDNNQTSSDSNNSDLTQSTNLPLNSCSKEAAVTRSVNDSENNSRPIVVETQ